MKKLKASANLNNVGKVFPSSGEFGWLKIAPTVAAISADGDVDVTYEYWRSEWSEEIYEPTTTPNPLN